MLYSEFEASPLSYMKLKSLLGVVAHTSNPSSWEAGAGAYEFLASLGHTVSETLSQNQTKGNSENEDLFNVNLNNGVQRSPSLSLGSQQEV